MIEALTSEDWTRESLEKRMTDIYKYSHCAIKKCKDPHTKWQNELLNIYEKFKQDKIIL